MTINVPFLRSSRDFPEDQQALRMELNRAYLDTSNAVNVRTIGIHTADRSSVNGESWYLTAQKVQGLRQVYPFTAVGNIAHGLNWNSVFAISPKSCGTFTDGSNWYGCAYLGSTAVAGEVTFYVTDMNIVVLAGAGAPTISSGIIDLEWLSNI